VTNWVELQGSANARDVGGMPTIDGRVVRSGVLIRSANLQHLTEDDVRYLVAELGVRRVVDLRTDIEVDRTGPGPLHQVPDVTIHHLSLYPDVLDTTESHSEQPDNGERPDALMPWQGKKFATEHGPVVSSYLQYLQVRPDSILAALRAIADPDGATVVHCAAGKDRTGVVVALALAVAGVPDEAIAADYALTESQLGAIIAQLAKSDLYTREVSQPERIPMPTAAIMLEVLAAVADEFGGVLSWLDSHGWTASETQRLRTKLLG
jgi:protein tyrosine/serine phosphatase